MRFNDLRKDELVQAAEHYKVEIDADATKAEISTALLDAGKTPEEWEKQVRVIEGEVLKEESW